MDDILLMPRQVIQDCAAGAEYRLLWVPKEPDQVAYWIVLSERINTPTGIMLRELMDGIKSGRYSLIPDKHMAKPPAAPTEAAVKHRDRAWSIIEDAVKREPAIYEKSTRVEILKELEESSGVKRNNIYGYLGRYWRGGMIPNALLPSYENCGKTDPLSNPSAKRRGRKKVEGAEGKRLTLKDTQNFAAAIRKYYKTDDNLSLEMVYKKMLKDFYAVRDENGEFISLLPPDELPSRGQFLYWHSKNKDVLAEAKARDGKKNEPLKHRSSIERTETFLSGPCASAQIDATMADIFLVRQDDRTAIVGRPFMYFLMDSYTRMVLGMHITLSPPSWASASRCILNALEDKAQYCASFGESITPEEWPCRHLPSAIIADRGEMENSIADTLVKELGISIENMPPYRGDLKGIIEKHFNLIDVEISDLPGKMGKDYGQRCTYDYRLDATLDIKEFTRIIILLVLKYNNYHYMEYYQRSPQMMQLHVLPVPKNLWDYGIRYCNGAQRVMEVSRIRHAILPKGTGTITRHGIKYHSYYYGCELAFKERWFDLANEEGHTKITVAYDPEDASYIYVRPDAMSDPVLCHVLDSSKMEEPLTEMEIAQRESQVHEERERYRPVEDSANVRTDDVIDGIVKGAEERKPTSEKSKAKRIKEIRENRQEEVKAGSSSQGSPDVHQDGTAGKPEEDGNKEEMDPIQAILEVELNKVLGGGKNGGC